MRSLISSALRSLLTRRPATRTHRKARPNSRLELDVLGDRLTPAITVEDIKVYEGDFNTTDATFIIKNTYLTPVQVGYYTTRGVGYGMGGGGSNYQDISGSVSVAANGNVPITVKVNGDLNPENDQYIGLAYYVDKAGVNHLQPPVAMCTIVDDDPLVSISDGSAYENQTNLGFEIKLVDAAGNPKPITNPNKTIVVNYTTKDGSAIAETDYKRQSSSIQIGQNVSNAMIQIPLIDDLLHEDSETFSIDLGSTNAGGYYKGIHSATGTIKDNDPTSDTQAPTTPGNLQANNATPSGVTLSWQASSDNVGVTDYTIYSRLGSGSLNPLTTTNGTTYNVSGLSASSQYSFYVVANDAAGNHSAQSNTLKVDTLALPDTQAPTAPGNPQASNITPSSITLSWQESTDNVGVAGYTVYSLQSNGTFSPITTTTSTSYTVSGLAASTKYSFYVVARDAAGNVSPLSTTVTISTQSPPTEAVSFGGSDQVPVGRCDFDGDGKTDLATYQTWSGIWSIKESSTGRVYGVQWGGSDQVPVGGCDFDGDGKTDLAAYHKPDGVWSIRYSRTGLGQAIQWGGSDQVPVGACDFDGDHKTDLVAYQPSSAYWSIRLSSSSMGQAIRFGGSDQVPVGGCDFDGDHKTDLATYQTGTGVWSIKEWATGRVYGVQWGGSDQVAVGGCDFDGDGKTDLAAYRTSDGMCSIKYSSNGLGSAIQWGGSNQVSVGGCDFDGDGKTDLVAYRTTDGMWSIRHR